MNSPPLPLSSLQLFSMIDMKPPISRAKMMSITKSAIKAIKVGRVECHFICTCDSVLTYSSYLLQLLTLSFSCGQLYKHVVQIVEKFIKKVCNWPTIPTLLYLIPGHAILYHTKLYLLTHSCIELSMIFFVVHKRQCPISCNNQSSLCISDVLTSLSCLHCFFFN